MHHNAPYTCTSHCLSKQASITIFSQRTTNQPMKHNIVTRGDPEKNFAVRDDTKKTTSWALNLVDSSFVNHAHPTKKISSYEISEAERETPKDSTNTNTTTTTIQQHQHINTNNNTNNRLKQTQRQQATTNISNSYYYYSC